MSMIPFLFHQYRERDADPATFKRIYNKCAHLNIQTIDSEKHITDAT
jgi:hypothetical protein